MVGDPLVAEDGSETPRAVLAVRPASVVESESNWRVRD